LDTWFSALPFSRLRIGFGSVFFKDWIWFGCFAASRQVLWVWILVWFSLVLDFLSNLL
jgi:hypothetical protein